MNFSFANLDFNHVKVPFSFLQNANCSQTSFYGADLSFADISNANLKFCNLDSANLQKAKFNKNFYLTGHSAEINDI